MWPCVVIYESYDVADVAVIITLLSHHVTSTLQKNKMRRLFQGCFGAIGSLLIIPPIVISNNNVFNEKDGEEEGKPCAFNRGIFCFFSFHTSNNERTKTSRRTHTHTHSTLSERTES